MVKMVLFDKKKVEKGLIQGHFGSKRVILGPKGSFRVISSPKWSFPIKNAVQGNFRLFWADKKIL